MSLKDRLKTHTNAVHDEINEHEFIVKLMQRKLSQREEYNFYRYQFKWLLSQIFRLIQLGKGSKDSGITGICKNYQTLFDSLFESGLFSFEDILIDDAEVDSKSVDETFLGYSYVTIGSLNGFGMIHQMLIKTENPLILGLNVSLDRSCLLSVWKDLVVFLNNLKTLADQEEEILYFANSLFAEYKTEFQENQPKF